MKKLLALVLACVMSLSMAACSSAPAASAGSSSAGGSASGGSAFSFDSPITVVVPFKAGSATDNQIRLMQSKLEKALGTNLVIVNAEGGSGTIGTTEYLTNYAADGYTILYTLATPVVYKPLGGDTAYTYDDLTSVARTSSQPMYLIVPDSETRSAQEILDYIKENPGKFTYANAGNGGIAHLAFASFLKAEGLDALSVPFTGGTADCYTAVMGGHVMGHSVSENDLVGRTDYNVLINLGTKSTTPGFENVPTLAELGYEGYCTDTFAGFYYMKGVDQAAVDAFDAAVNATLEDPDFQKAAEEANFGYHYANSADFTDMIHNTVELITPVLAELG